METERGSSKYFAHGLIRTAEGAKTEDDLEENLRQLGIASPANPIDRSLQLTGGEEPPPERAPVVPE